MLLQISRYILSIIVFFGGSFVLVVLMALGFGGDDRAVFYSHTLMPILQKILGIRVEVRNIHRLSQHRPCVVVGNHQHTFDLFVHGPLLPEGTITIGKKSIRYIPIFGWVFVMSRCILIDRSQRHSAIESMKIAGDEMLARRRVVWMFPEGTRSLKRGLLPFKKGAFYLAIQSKTPLVPFIASSYYKSIDLKKWNAGTVLVDVLEPIPTASLSVSDAQALLDQTHAKMKHQLFLLDQEVESRLKTSAQS